MQKYKYTKNVSDYINRAAKDQVATLEELRKLIHENVKDVSETIKWNMPVFSSATNIAYLRFSKNHITLGFYNIEKLKDPENLLEGEGNTLKHIKIKILTPQLKKQISSWLQQITT